MFTILALQSLATDAVEVDPNNSTQSICCEGSTKSWLGCC